MKSWNTALGRRRVTWLHHFDICNTPGGSLSCHFVTRSHDHWRRWRISVSLATQQKIVVKFFAANISYNLNTLLYPVNTATVFKNYQKSLIFASEASYVYFWKKPLVNHLCPFSSGFRFFQIQVIYSVKWSEKIWKKFSRGKNDSPKVSKVTLLVTIKVRIF